MGSERSGSAESPLDEVEEGDSLMCMMLPPEAEYIRTTQMTSQRLAKAHYKTFELRPRSPITSKILRVYLPRNLLMNSLIGRFEIMPLNWN